VKFPKINRWVLSFHALQRMEERKISSSEIQEILTRPDFVITQGAKIILAKHFSERKDNLIAAVIAEKKEEGLWVVVTVMIQFAIQVEKKSNRKKR
jgi:hypothetical protein